AVLRRGVYFLTLGILLATLSTSSSAPGPSSSRQGVAQGRYTGHCMGMSHVTSHGTMPRAFNGSISLERCMEHCVGTLHRAGKRGSPTTDPIPIPAPVCHIWGFYPPEVTVIWLHNGDIVEPDDYNPISAIPNGDWTYQTQESLLVAPVAGDTYTCSVQRVSLQEPLLEDWSEWRGAGPHPEAGGLGSLLPLTRNALMRGIGFLSSGCYKGMTPSSFSPGGRVQGKRDSPSLSAFSSGKA
uniref:Ig-like domain-containing protein n=1 Tax=Anas platyrhynchos platyrhynchos TaxID=8840 RepID=A0A493SSG6_ANAPP